MAGIEHVKFNASPYKTGKRVTINVYQLILNSVMSKYCGKMFLVEKKQCFNIIVQSFLLRSGPCETCHDVTQ